MSGWRRSSSATAPPAFTRSELAILMVPPRLGFLGRDVRLTGWTSATPSRGPTVRSPQDEVASRDDVGGELVGQEGDAVLQPQLALLEALHLEAVARGQPLQCLDGGIEVAVLLQQARRSEEHTSELQS